MLARMGSSGMWMQMAASLGSTFLHVAISIVFLVVAYVYVRPMRPDAWPLVAGWAAASIVLTGLHMAATTLVPMLLVRTSGVGAMSTMFALITATFAILRAGIDCVLVYAIVLLAKGRQGGGAG